ncbi:hypothetical protein SH1V18_26070 [Vallitalea longa]|uniref:DUF58 domain-containing protein n=1 Tax=Vallitalea longa TaxID=2936439 RepID=A0A9W5YA35_9FIRM|nr:DUF58 domain-containing protein [Vallitalea longa]GKX30127.1 hypothetical protein SH1V18_26070 [Vallitalea longa]
MNEQIFTSDFMSKLEKLSVCIKNTAAYGSAGSRKSKAKGMSVEFSDYRKYVPSDDFRRIDWNAYGKFKKLYIKLFMEEKEAVFNIFIDNSKSMAFYNKNRVTLQLAAVFSYIALNNLDKVLINPLVSNESNIFLGQGKNSFMKYINYLENIKFDAEKSNFVKLKRSHFRGSGISIILSDLFTNDELDDVIKFLTYNKQQILVLHILSAEEIAPTIDGRFKLVDSETGQEKNLIMTPNLLKKYNEKLEKYSNDINNVCNKYGASYIRINSSDTVEKIILEDLINTFTML